MRWRRRRGPRQAAPDWRLQACTRLGAPDVCATAAPRARVDCALLSPSLRKEHHEHPACCRWQPLHQENAGLPGTHKELRGSQHTYPVLTVQPPLPARARAALGKEAVDSYHSEEADKILAPVCKFLARHA